MAPVGRPTTPVGSPLQLAAGEVALPPFILVDRAADVQATWYGTPISNSPETPVEWSIDDTLVARVSSTGHVVGLRAGTTTVRAAHDGWEAVATVDVSPQVDRDGYRIAHRGYGALFPENTLAAFDSAWARGADAIELDVWMSSDAVPMVMHDSTVDRTTDGSGGVNTMTAAQLEALNACARHPVYGRCAVPRLATVLAQADGRPALVELKGHWSDAHLRAVLAVIDGVAHPDNVVVTSFSVDNLRRLRAMARNRPVGILAWDLVRLDDLESLAPVGLLIKHDAFTTDVELGRAYLRRARQRGIDVAAWTVRNAETMARVRAVGPIRVIQDAPLADAP